MTSKKFTKEQLRYLAMAPFNAWCETVGELYGWESEGFGDLTLSEFADLLWEYIKNKRKEGATE